MSAARCCGCAGAFSRGEDQAVILPCPARELTLALLQLAVEQQRGHAPLRELERPA